MLHSLKKFLLIIIITHPTDTWFRGTQGVSFRNQGTGIFVSGQSWIYCVGWQAVEFVGSSFSSETRSYENSCPWILPLLVASPHQVLGLRILQIPCRSATLVQHSPSWPLWALGSACRKFYISAGLSQTNLILKGPLRPLEALGNPAAAPGLWRLGCVAITGWGLFPLQFANPLALNVLHTC